MTKNNSTNNSEKMAQSNPTSPHEDVMHFIENLGEQLEEVMSAATRSPGTEKGDPMNTDNEKGESAAGPSKEAGGPPEYWQTQFEAGDKRDPEDRRRRCGGPQGDRKDANWGPWGRGHPWGAWDRTRGDDKNEPFAGAWIGGPEGPFGMGGFMGMGGGCRGRGGFGGFGGRGGAERMSFGGPWGWKDRRDWHHRGGPHGRHHHHHRGDDRDGNNDQEFTPALDIFDTPENFVVHVALAGALKSDIGINYDVDNSTLEISGVVTRPGDEDFLKTIYENERRVGAFSRKIKFEPQGKPVPVDADAITAQLENGLLIVTVPKLKKSEEPEKKKINID